MKEQKDWHLNAIALAFTAYGRRVSVIVADQQARFVKSDYAKMATLTVIGPQREDIEDTKEMLHQAYLCGIEEGKRQPRGKRK